MEPIKFLQKEVICAPRFFKESVTAEKTFSDHGVHLLVFFS